MKTIILAGREEWLEWRQSGIGGSDAPALMGASPWMTREQLWALKTGRMPGVKRTPWMQRGLDLEDKAREAYERYTGIWMPSAFGEHLTHPFVLGSLDGINTTVKKVLEIKCPGKEDHRTALQGKIPEKYLWQCVHLLLLTGYESGDYFSYDGEKGVVIPFFRDEKKIAALLKAEKNFWVNHILKDVCPKEKPKTNVLDNGNLFKIRSRRKHG